MRWWACLLLLSSLSVGAVERVSVCYNYGCQSQAEVVFSDDQLAEVGRLLRSAATPVQEREAIARAVGRMLGWAGEQSPIKADRGGNTADEGVSGKMDCIDHSTTTTRLLRVLEQLGLLRYHHVLEPALRRRFLLFEHYSAQIEENSARADGSCGGDGAPARYVVDSWFFDNGHPAAILPLARWMSGEGPDSDE